MLVIDDIKKYLNGHGLASVRQYTGFFYVTLAISFTILGTGEGTVPQKGQKSFESAFHFPSWEGHLHDTCVCV